ncbi:hypothetical protein CLV77_2458 [Brevirhabdus pacifica]|nr:hypothetical protein CLV77_2458 [Brevirhabdus pacifica]
MWPGLAASAWVVAALAVLAGTMLQRLAGQGFGMIAAPMVAMVAPEFVPATLLLVGIAVGLSSTAVDLRLVERADLPAGFAGRAAGAVLAALVAQRLAGDPALVAWVVGGTVYLGIALSLLGVRVAISRLSLFGAGVTAGLMGTLTAVGAPPMALLYQYHEARRSAAMQNVFFFWGMTVSILALAWQGLVGLTDLVLALSLLPMVALGVALAGLVARGDPLGQGRARMRPVALGLAALAATALIVTRAI